MTGGVTLFLIACGTLAPAQSAGNVYQQGGAPEYLVSVEGENSNGVTPAPADPDNHTWVLDTGFAGFSGSGAMRSLPDILTAAVDTPGYSAISSRIDFRVNFITAGQHFVWIRGTAPVGATDDSLHVGLDGQEIPSADKISGWGTFGGSGYQWINNTMDPSVGAVLVVSTPGVHTINVWMREDGFVLDKLVLTSDATYLPIGMGPAENAQVPDPGTGGGSPPPVVSGGGSGRDNPNGDGWINDACGLLGLELLLLVGLVRMLRPARP